MSSRFRFVVEIELERTEGKFAGRDEMVEQLQSALEDANPSTVDGIGADGMSAYEVVGWDVNEEEVPTRIRNYKTAEGFQGSVVEPVPTRGSHAECTHPKTPAARAACRAARGR